MPQSQVIVDRFYENLKSISTDLNSVECEIAKYNLPSKSIWEFAKSQQSSPLTISWERLHNTVININLDEYYQEAVYHSVFKQLEALSHETVNVESLSNTLSDLWFFKVISAISEPEYDSFEIPLDYNTIKRLAVTYMWFLNRNFIPFRINVANSTYLVADIRTLKVYKI